MEREAHHRFSSGKVRPDVDPVVNRLWLMQKFVDIVAGTAGLRTATAKFAYRLGEAVTGEMPEDRDLAKYLGDQRGEFLKAARHELGVTEE